MKAVRVLFWSGAFPPGIGGVEVLAGQFVRAMREGGHELLVITGRDAEDPPDVARHHRVPVHRLPFQAALAEQDPDRMLRIGRRVADLKRAFQPDLVHVNHPGLGVLFHRQTASVHPAPVLVTLHGTHPDRSYGPGTLYGPLLRTASWVVACSAAVLRETRRQLPELTPRSSVIHSALAVPSTVPEPIRFDPPRLLCVGRFTPEKGFDLALAAFAALVERFPAARLVIAGDGPGRTGLQARAVDLGIGRRVDFLGWVAPEQVAGLINRATVVVIPSRSESLGLVALQAAQMRRPIVATRVGGSRS